MNIDTAIYKGKNILRSRYIKTAQLDSEILLAQVINKSREYIILNQDIIIRQDSYNFFKDLIKKRSTGKPIAYLTGKKDFAKKYLSDGFTFVAINSDTNLIARSAENLLKEFK